MNAQLDAPNTEIATRPTTPPAEVVPSVEALASDIGAEAQTLVEQHGTLLKAELKETGEQATWSAVLIAGGAGGVAVGSLFLLVGLVGLTAWLFPTLPAWAAWVIWGGGLLLVAGTALFFGARTVSQMNLVPHRTLRSLWESLTCLLKRRK